MNPTRALIYLRVSTDRQAQKDISLPTQKERCLSRALDEGYTVDPKADIYVDGGESAQTMNRPALLDLLSRAKEDKEIHAVVVYDISRLARNRLDFALIKQQLRKRGVRLISATEPIDESPEGQMLEGVLSTVAEFFSAQSGRKVKASMRHKAETGVWPTLAPYGYVNRREKLSDGEIRAWIEPKPEEALWVRRAFDLFSTGKYSVKMLASTLNKEGFIVRRAKNRMSKFLHYSQLERMLRNKIYIGVVEWGGIVNENGTHEKIVDPELFYRVQDLLLLRAGSTTRMRRHRSLFKGIAYCDECKSAMTIDLKETSSTRSIRYLRCRKVQQGKPVNCSQGYFAEEIYTTQLHALLNWVELPPAEIEALKSKIELLAGEEQNVYERARRDALREQELVAKRQEKLLLRSIEDGPQTDAERLVYERVRASLAQEEKRLARKLENLQVRLGRIAKILSMAVEIAGSASKGFLAERDPDYRGLIARVLFKEIRMSGGKIVGGKPRDCLALFRRWISENTLEPLADLALFCAPNRVLMDGHKVRHRRQVSLSAIRKDMVQLEKILTPEEEAEIEACYCELRGKRILLP